MQYTETILKQRSISHSIEMRPVNLHIGKINDCLCAACEVVANCDIFGSRRLETYFLDEIEYAAHVHEAVNIDCES